MNQKFCYPFTSTTSAMKMLTSTTSVMEMQPLILHTILFHFSLDVFPSILTPCTDDICGTLLLLHTYIHHISNENAAPDFAHNFISFLARFVSEPADPL